MSQVYFDHNATTPLDESVFLAMMPYMQGQYGNPSSRHSFGRIARQAVDEAREQLADAVGAHPSQVIFTSGGTEANNLAIRGMAAVLPPAQVVWGSIEHPCVAKPCQSLKVQGWEPRPLAVDDAGRFAMDDLAQALQVTTGLVSVMLANNETGALQDVAEVAKLARAAGAWVHTDAVQALGKIRLDFAELGVHAMSLSSHKVYGPKGVGALVLDKRIELMPQMTGGGHEKGLRAGTENVPGIVGFAAACELAVSRMQQDAEMLGRMRNELETGVAAQGGVIFGSGARRLANTSYFAIPGIEGETLLIALDRAGFAVASGSACASGSTEPSAVLLAMGVEPELAKGAIRVSLGRGNSMQQIEEFVRVLRAELKRLRTLSAVAVM